MALIFILKRYKKAYYNVKMNVFNDLFCEKKIINLENHTNCNSQYIAKHSVCVRNCAKTKQQWSKNKYRCEYLETNFTSAKNL